VQVNNLLGATTQKCAFVLVEDRAAHQFTIALLGETNPDVLSQVEVAQVGSAAKIDSVLSTLPLSNHGWLSMIGVYDGDMRARVDPSQFNWPHLFLPGNASPEQVLRDCLTSREDGQEILATELNRTSDSVA